MADIFNCLRSDRCVLSLLFLNLLRWARGVHRLSKLSHFDREFVMKNEAYSVPSSWDGNEHGTSGPAHIWYSHPSQTAGSQALSRDT